jgi:hypothetical protein
MALVIRNGITLGERIDYGIVISREWRGECGCMLAVVTTERVVIHPNTKRIYRVRRPLMDPVEAVCVHGLEHRLAEEDAERLIARCPGLT